MASRSQALAYLRSIGYTDPDEGEIQGAIEYLRSTGANSGAGYTPPTPPATTPTSAPTPTTPTTPNPTVGSVYSPFLPPSVTSKMQGYRIDHLGNTIITDEYGREANYGNEALSRSAEEARIRNETLARFQKEIDAVNSIYGEKLAEAKTAGLGRLGSGRAIQARSGTLGSDFASAQNDNITSANTAIENTVREELAGKISAIMGKAETISSGEIASKRAAQEAGLTKYLDYLKSLPDKKKSNLETLSQAFIAQDVSPDKLDPSVLKDLTTKFGVTEGDIVSSYKLAKQNYDQTKQKNTLDIEKIKADIAKGKYVNIGDGDQLYNTETGQVVENPKDAATGSGAFSLTPYQQFQGIQSLQSSLQKNTTAAQTAARFSQIIVDTYNRLERGENKDLNATTQAIITSFNKLTDPASVVRESEYARSVDGQALLSTIEGKIAALVQGGPGLTKQSLKEFVDLSKIFAKNSIDSINAQNKRAKDIATTFGLPADLVGTPSNFTTQTPQTQIEDAGFNYNQIKAAYPNTTDEYLLQLLGIS